MAAAQVKVAAMAEVMALTEEIKISLEGQEMQQLALAEEEPKALTTHLTGFVKTIITMEKVLGDACAHGIVHGKII